MKNYALFILNSNLAGHPASYLPSLATTEVVKKLRVGAATMKNNLADESHVTLTPGFLSGLMLPALHTTAQQHQTH